MAGFVFYDGPSSIDGAPIIGVAVLKSENGKTGNMVQTYILRADMAPLSAIADGADAPNPEETMSYSNPMHHPPGARRPAPRPWPFPARLLDYPSAPPLARPARAPVTPPVNAPEAPF